jgi:hypothetical protein
VQQECRKAEFRAVPIGPREHLLCKQEPSFQQFLPLSSLSSVSNNFGESASRSK